MANNEKTGVRRSNKLTNFSTDLNTKGKCQDSAGSVDSRQAQDKRSRVPHDHPDSMNEEPVSITYVWPKRSLEAVLADLREDECANLNLRQPDFSPPLLLSAPSHTRAVPGAVYRSNSDEGSLQAHGLTLDEPDSLKEDRNDPSEEGEELIYIYARSIDESEDNNKGEDDPNSEGDDDPSSDEGEDSGDEDYVPTWDDCEDPIPVITRRHSKSRMSSRKRRNLNKGILEVHADGLERDRDEHGSLKECGDYLSEDDKGYLDEHYSRRERGGDSSDSEGDDSKDVDYVPVPDDYKDENLMMQQREPQNLRSSRKRRQIALLPTSREDTFSGIVKEIVELQERCRHENSLLLYQQKKPSSPNSAYNLRRRKK